VSVAGSVTGDRPACGEYRERDPANAAQAYDAIDGHVPESDRDAELIGWINRANHAHPWSHNDHYHRWLLRQLPPRATRSIDVGWRTGNLVRALASRVDQATGTDIDPETIAIARSQSAGNTNVEFHTAPSQSGRYWL